MGNYSVPASLYHSLKALPITSNRKLPPSMIFTLKLVNSFETTKFFNEIEPSPPRIPDLGTALSNNKKNGVYSGWLRISSTIAGRKKSRASAHFPNPMNFLSAGR